MIKPKRDVGKALGFRSGLEESVAQHLALAGVFFEYEARRLKFTQPPMHRTYTPDFILPNGIIIETKGRFVVGDRKKHLWLKEQHPNLDIRFVFTRAATKISKGSKTSYADWCNQNGFKYVDKRIPEAWLKEPFSKDRWEAIEAATK